MTSRITITVGNLPESTTAADIIAFFDTRIKNAGVVVYSIVYDRQVSSKVSKRATVGLNREMKNEALRCNGKIFSAARGGESSQIEIVPPFSGVVTLEFHEDWEFDVYFVHDVGGDVYGSWTNDSTDHMWIRDSFPAQCLDLGLHGRFTSLAHNASGKLVDIQSAAEDILEFVAADRLPCSTRPIFFVCDGRGGIVLTQALTLALSQPAATSKFQCMQQVRGIAYFETPFQGASTNCCSTPLSGLYRNMRFTPGGYIAGITRRIARSTFPPSKLSRLMAAFNDIRNREGIEVLVFIGESPDRPKRKTQVSAPPFQPPVTTIGINAGYPDMVRFASENEARVAITEIIEMIEGKLNTPTTPALPYIPQPLISFPSPSFPPDPEVTARQVPGDKGKETQGGDMTDKYSRPVPFHTVFVIDDTGSMRDPVDSNKPTAFGKTRWDVLTRGMRSIGDIEVGSGANEVGIHFLKSTHLDKTNIASGQEILNILAQVNLDQEVVGTYVDAALAEILGPYVARYGERVCAVGPLNVIVLTDGKAHDAKSVEKTIAKIGEKLDALGAPDTQVRLVFLQIGDDNAAAEWLKRLGASRVGVRKYVYARTFGDSENPDLTEVLQDVLLEAVQRETGSGADR